MRRFGLKHFQQSNNHFLFAIFLLTFLTDAVVHAQRVETIPSSVVLVKGESTSLLCRYGRPINYCLMIVPGTVNPLVLSDKWKSPEPGYSYYGEGLAAGQCGVTIDHVLPQNHGKLICRPLSEGQQLEGTIDITVALAPQPPELDIRAPTDKRTYEVDELIRVNCISRDGRPAANLTWYLNDEPLTQGLGMPEVVESFHSNTTLLTVTQEISRYITPGDDGKSLICRSTHLADQNQPREARLQLSVKYRPQPLPEIRVYGLTLDRTAIINVTIQSNPRPKTEWINEGLAIPQGTQNGRYESFEPVSLGNGAYNVSLSIASLTLEDTTKTYRLKASNEYGSQDYAVRISSLDTPPSNGLEIGAIVGIAVVVVIVLIAVLLLVFAKATRRWCFGGASLNTDIGPDSEAQINPNHHDDYDGKEYDGQEHIDTTHAGDETPPVTDKLDQEIKNDLKKSANGQHQNGKEIKTNTPV